MRYLSVAETAKKWDISERSVRNYCAHGRVPGAFLTGKTWNIPENAKKPERANKRVKKSTEKAFASTVKGYSSVTTENSSIQLQNGKAKYALYPVWLLNTTWNGKKYTFAMNGQTGKFVGDLPVDKSVAVKWMLGLTAVFSVLTYGGVYLLHLVGI